jgi:hypothetical protein
MNFLLILLFRAATCFAVVPQDDLYPIWVDQTLEQTGLDSRLVSADWYGTDLPAGSKIITGFSATDSHGIVFSCDYPPGEARY